MIGTKATGYTHSFYDVGSYNIALGKSNPDQTGSSSLFYYLEGAIGAFRLTKSALYASDSGFDTKLTSWPIPEYWDDYSDAYNDE